MVMTDMFVEGWSGWPPLHRKSKSVLRNGGRQRRVDEDDEEDKEDNMDIGEGDSDVTMDPEFPTAFTGRPVKCTPVVIAMFMAYKCFTEDLGISTANAIHAAFIRYYDMM